MTELPLQHSSPGSRGSQRVHLQPMPGNWYRSFHGCDPVRRGHDVYDSVECKAGSGRFPLKRWDRGSPRLPRGCRPLSRILEAVTDGLFVAYRRQSQANIGNGGGGTKVAAPPYSLMMSVRITGGRWSSLAIAAAAGG